MAAKRKRLEEEAQSNPSILLSPPSPIRREDKWKYAHQKRSGSYTSEQARIVGNKIEELQKKQVEGSFRTEGRNDILTVASGKQEHPGRVRGIGGGIGIREYFGASPHHSSNVVTREEMEQMLATVRIEARAEARAEAEASFDARLEARLSQMKEEMMILMSSRQETSIPQTHSPAPNQSTKGSCTIIRHSSGDHAIQDDDLYYLFVEDPLKRLVARGSIQNLGPTVHHKEIKDDQVRVTVEEVIIADAFVPIPTGEVKTVGEAKNTFVLWPKNLVLTHAEAKLVGEAKNTTPIATQLNKQVSQPQLNAVQHVILMAYDKSFESR